MSRSLVLFSRYNRFTLPICLSAGTIGFFMDVHTGDYSYRIFADPLHLEDRCTIAAVNIITGYMWPIVAPLYLYGLYRESKK